MADGDSADDVLRRHEKVVATEAMPGVPVGTKGRVMLVDGITWIRYRVAFDNGVERGTIDRSSLTRLKDYEPTTT
jgi:hypothetical protein